MFDMARDEYQLQADITRLLCYTVYISLRFIFIPLPSNIRHLSCDDCQEDKREDYQNSELFSAHNCTVISTQRTQMSSSCRCTKGCWFKLRRLV